MSDTLEDTINAQAPRQADIACPECGAPFAPRGNKRFCQRKCQADFNNRMAAEGKILAPLVKAMMATRGGGHKAALPICGAARTELTRIAKIFNDADKAAGRPPVHLYVERLFNGQVFYMDRRRLPEPLDGGGGWAPHQKVPARAALETPTQCRPLEAIEVPGGPFVSEDDAIDRGWPAMRAHCTAQGYPSPGAAAANPDKEKPGTFKLNGFYATGGNNRRKRRSHPLVVRGV